MPDTDPPTLGEIMRRLDTITAQLAEIVREIRQDRLDNASTYMRQDVWIRERELINAFISDTRTDIGTVDTKIEADRAGYKKDRLTDATNRRTLLFWLGSVTVTLLLGIAGLIVTLVTR